MGYSSLRRVNAAYRRPLWLAGNRRSDTLATLELPSVQRCGLRGIVARIHSIRHCWTDSYALWLAGNRRSDTLDERATVAATMLWLAGNRRSDTLQCGTHPRDACCGLRGIVARIHCLSA